MRAHRFAIGVAAALVGAACWGFSGTCMQYLFMNYSMPVLFVATFRMLVAGTVFTLVLLVVQRERLLGLLHDGRSMRRVVVFGFVGLFVCQVTYMIAIDYTNAGTATVLQAFNVVIVLGVTCVGARRLPRAAECVAVCLALLATVLIATKGDFTTLRIPALGLFWGLVSAAAVTFYVCYPKSLFDKWTSPPVTALGMLVGGLVALVCLVASELAGASGADAGAGASTTAASGAAFWWLAEIDATAMAALLAIAIVGTLCSFGLYLFGVSIVGSMKGSLLGTVEPAAATIIAAVWLNTAFSWADWLGMALMIATVFIVSLQPTPPASKRPAASD